jgi:putative methionine-R-sulfoxide reductase with GAF domain
VDGELLGVLDLDSPSRGRFDAEDQAGCEKLIALLGPRLRSDSQRSEPLTQLQSMCS